MQPARRTNTEGNPARTVSPWMDLNISHTFRVVMSFVLRSAGEAFLFH